MLTEFCSNRVFYSAKMPEACPKSYRAITKILEKYGVPHEALKATKDIWVRDFMPIQGKQGYLYRYNYMPDYLRTDARYRHLISDPEEVCEAHGLDTPRSQMAKRIIEAFVRRPHKTLILISHFPSEYPPCITHELHLQK